MTVYWRSKPKTNFHLILIKSLCIGGQLNFWRILTSIEEDYSEIDRIQYNLQKNLIKIISLLQTKTKKKHKYSWSFYSVRIAIECKNSTQKQTVHLWASTQRPLSFTLLREVMLDT